MGRRFFAGLLSVTFLTWVGLGLLRPRKGKAMSLSNNPRTSSTAPTASTPPATAAAALEGDERAKRDLERRKLRLEARKLRLEMVKLERETPLLVNEWKKPGTWLGSMTALVAVLAFIAQSYQSTAKFERAQAAADKAEAVLLQKTNELQAKNALLETDVRQRSAEAAALRGTLTNLRTKILLARAELVAAEVGQFGGAAAELRKTILRLGQILNDEPGQPSTAPSTPILFDNNLDVAVHFGVTPPANRAFTDTTRGWSRHTSRHTSRRSPRRRCLPSLRSMTKGRRAHS
jgi:hypothetical protein